jgi:hypothetical protein
MLEADWTRRNRTDPSAKLTTSMADVAGPEQDMLEGGFDWRLQVD